MFCVSARISKNMFSLQYTCEHAEVRPISSRDGGAIVDISAKLSRKGSIISYSQMCFSFYMYVLSIVVCPFVHYPLAIVLSVLLRYTDSDYPFGIFKLFFLFTWRKVHISLPKDTTHRMTTVLLQVDCHL
jgi:hypothetical protein